MTVARHGWKRIGGVGQQTDVAAEWRRRIVDLQGEQQRLEAASLWSRPPKDLLSICGIHRRELVHGAALAWLCQPTGDHGLGDAFVRRLLGLAGEAPPPDGDVWVDTEVPRGQSRADLVVGTDAWTLIVELKIDAAESTAQCERLHLDWRDEPGLRLLFITPTGRLPSTVVTAEARAAWRTASWRTVLELLDQSLAKIPASSATSPALAQYRHTMYRLFGRSAR